MNQHGSPPTRMRLYQVPPLGAGSYFFRCDVHTDMNGTLVAG